MTKSARIFDAIAFTTITNKGSSVSSSPVTKIPPSLTSSSSAGGTVIRPKIMRRPAQFSNPSPVIIVQEPALNAPAESVATITPTPWQDDGRFAIALVLLLIGVNLLASAWLSPTNTPVKPIVSQRVEAPAVTILNELNPPESNQ